MEKGKKKLSALAAKQRELDFGKRKNGKQTQTVSIACLP
jgi:hypothetical protein